MESRHEEQHTSVRNLAADGPTGYNFVPGKDYTYVGTGRSSGREDAVHEPQAAHQRPCVRLDRSDDPD